MPQHDQVRVTGLPVASAGLSSASSGRSQQTQFGESRVSRVSRSLSHSSGSSTSSAASAASAALGLDEASLRTHSRKHPRGRGANGRRNGRHNASAETGCDALGLLVDDLALMFIAAYMETPSDVEGGAAWMWLLSAAPLVCSALGTRRRSAVDRDAIDAFVAYQRFIVATHNWTEVHGAPQAVFGQPDQPGQPGQPDPSPVAPSWRATLALMSARMANKRWLGWGVPRGLDVQYVPARDGDAATQHKLCSPSHMHRYVSVDANLCLGALRENRLLIGKSIQGTQRDAETGGSSEDALAVPAQALGLPKATPPKLIRFVRALRAFDFHVARMEQQAGSLVSVHRCAASDCRRRVVRRRGATHSLSDLVSDAFAEAPTCHPCDSDYWAQLCAPPDSLSTRELRQPLRFCSPGCKHAHFARVWRASRLDPTLLHTFSPHASKGATLSAADRCAVETTHAIQRNQRMASLVPRGPSARDQERYGVSTYEEALRLRSALLRALDVDAIALLLTASTCGVQQFARRFRSLPGGKHGWRAEAHGHPAIQIVLAEVRRAVLREAGGVHNPHAAYAGPFVTTRSSLPAAARASLRRAVQIVDLAISEMPASH